MHSLGPAQPSPLPLTGIAGIALAAWFGGSHGRDTGHEEGVGESADDCAEGESV